MNEIIFLYITCNDVEEARSLGGACVQARLAGCANVLPGMLSIYQWEERLEESGEALLILKTTKGLLGALEDFVRERHSYTTPCIAVIPLSSINQDYKEWLLARVRG